MWRLLRLARYHTIVTGGLRRGKQFVKELKRRGWAFLSGFESKRKDRSFIRDAGYGQIAAMKLHNMFGDG